MQKSLKVLFESARLRVESFVSAEEFLRAFDPSRPGCLVVELILPGISGVELLEQLRARSITTPIIVFTGTADTTMATGAIRAGARDLCAKSRGTEHLLTSVREAIGALPRKGLDVGDRHTILERISALTPRERQVLALLAAGQRNREVASLLGISPGTVACHRASIMKKTRSDSAADLFQLWHIIKDA